MTRRDLMLAGAIGVLLVGATHSLSRVFLSGWRLPTLAAVAIALAIAAGVRQVGFGALASLVASAVGFVTFTYVVHLPAGGLLPGSEQLTAFLDILAGGMVEFRSEPAPTVPLPGLMLIVTTAAWWVTHLVHEILVRARRPGLGLVPAAILWGVPLGVPLPPGRTWTHALPFLAGAALILLLESDADVAGWARDRAGPYLSSGGVLVGAAALTVAAVVPGVLPGYEDEPWYSPANLNDPRGYQPIVDISDRLQLPTPRDVLEVQTSRRQYLRLAALDSFDGTTWRLGPPGETSFRPADAALHRATSDLPPEVPIARATTVQAQVRVLDLENIYVPVAYQPLRITGPARDQMVYSTDGGFVATAQLTERDVAGRLVPGVIEGLQYGVVSHVPAPLPEDLAGVVADPSEVGPWLDLPVPYERLAALAEEVYASRGAATQLDRALALQDFFIGPSSTFAYSVDVDPLRGSGALERFVFEDQIGYCEYYATAMAVMLRATGIPARVAVGFLGGREVVAPGNSGEDDGGGLQRTFRVSTEDAHAWVEVLFPGYGWIKFDPTPRSDGQIQPPTSDELDPLLSLAEQARARPGDVEPRDPVIEPDPFDPVLDDLPFERPAAGAGDDGTGAGRTLPLLVLGLVVAGLLAAVVASNWRVHHPGLPPPDRVLAAQRHVHAAARRYGVGRRPAETAVEVAHRWAREGRLARPDAQRFAELAQAAAFGGDVAHADGEEAERLGHALTSELRRSVPRSSRLAAPVRVPAETVLSAGRGAASRWRGHRGS